MKKLLVISDSHLLNTKEIFDFIKPDIAVHAGDSQYGIKDTNYFDYIVKGNCDFESYSQKIVFETMNKKIYLTHGHLQDVRYNNNGLIGEASLIGCNIIIHGHTHVVKTEVEKGILIVNPGSTYQSRSEYPTTFMVLNITKDDVEVLLYDAKSKEVIKKTIFGI